MFYLINVALGVAGVVLLVQGHMLMAGFGVVMIVTAGYLTLMGLYKARL